MTAAENTAAEARNELAKIRTALQAATDQLGQAQKARQAAELGAKDTREQFAQLRSARETADKHRPRDARTRRARAQCAHRGRAHVEESQDVALYALSAAVVAELSYRAMLPASPTITNGAQ